MNAMRSVLTLVRVVGVLAVVLVVYAWMYPARLGLWLSGGQSAPGGVPASASAAPGAMPAAASAPGPAAGAGQQQAAALPASAPVSRSVQASRSQAAVADWLGAKYRVSPAALEVLIVEADKLSKTYRLSPNLIIAVMAIESNFHPYIQSEAGAQGLMQVMPVIHAKRYEKFGGKSAFIDPIVSLKVGAEILRDCVKLKGGSETEALRFYFGGGAASDAYIDKVRAEQRRLNLVAAGKRVPLD